VFTDEPNIRPHGLQPKKRNVWESHHPESQKVLAETLESYNPASDITILLPRSTHVGTFGPQGAALRRPGYASRIGTPHALSEAVDIMTAAGIPHRQAVHVTLEHAGYLFRTVPADKVQMVLKTRGF
jgi:hypothetical protein